jgi:NTP pyrophosphatase (non-canonical NTP hydrolase)
MITSDIEKFVEEHELTVDNQMLCLMEECGELGEAVLRDDTDNIRAECADVVFVAYTVAMLATDDPAILTAEVERVAAENAMKSPTTDGDKVTKD